MVTEKLSKLQAAAARFRATVTGDCPAILKMLPFIQNDDVGTIVRLGGLDLDRLTSLSVSCHLPVNEVEDVIRRVLRYDLTDFADYYLKVQQASQASRFREREMKRMLPDYGTSSYIYFVLHDRCKVWCVEERLLGDVEVEDTFEDDSPADYLPIGFLIGRKMAFSTSLELLETSRHYDWPHWPIIWQYF